MIHFLEQKFLAESYINLYKILLDNLQLNPDKVYYYSQSSSVSFSQMHKLSMQLAQQLRDSIQFSRKPILAISLNNNEAILYLTWACLASGICLAFLPPINDSGMVRALMDQIEAEVLVTDLAELQSEPWSIPYETLKNGDYATGKIFDYSVRVANLSPDTPAFIFQTSGTTGAAKWVQVTHKQFLLAIECMKSEGCLTHAIAQVVYITSPLSHSYGLSSLIEYTSVGSSIVLPRGKSPLGAVGDLTDSTLANMITAIEGVPHFYFQMGRLMGRIKLPSLRHIGFGGGSLNLAVVKHISQTYPKLSYSVRYGMTETPSVISHKLFTHPYADDWESSGKILPVYHLRIVDETDEDVPPGKQGEIQIKGACLAWPYYGETDCDDFFSTGDIGYINSQQELCIVGRKSSFLKVRDYRISPEYIESIMVTFEGLLECRVSGMDSGILAEVVPTNNSLSVLALRSFLASKLPSYAIPETITLVKTIPRTLSGKVKRH